MQVFCPKCKAEYREGFTVCADCGVPLVETLPASPVLEPVFFFAAEGEAAGELSALLYRAGIRCYLKGDDGIFIRLDPELAVPGELYVDRRDLPMAKQCLRLLSGPPVPVDEEELLEAYEESVAMDTEKVSGDGAWKVFQALAALFVIMILAYIFMK